jgi:two-component system, NtrC family, sensor histidine kinase GlrK
MPFYRPKSFLKLVLSGFVLGMLPLIVAIIDATIRVDRLAEQSQRTISRAVWVLQGSRTLAEQATAMERYVKQYQVLGDESLFQAYVETHDKFQQVTHNLAAIIRNDAQEQQLVALTTKEQTLFETVQTYLRSPDQFTALTPEFTKLKELARAIMAENDKITEHDTEVMREEVATVRHLLVWQVMALILGAVAFSAIFVRLIARPIHQIDYAIQRLGAGEFATAIQITGPHDLEYLGYRLNWLRGRLRELEDEKRKFLQHISHELKTPLTALREGTALLEEEVVGQLNDAQREIVEILQENGTQLQKLIEDLLNFHLAQARHASLDIQPVSLDRVLDEVLTDQKLAVMGKEIAVHLTAAQVSLLGDREKLRIAIDNLLSNAVKYSPRGGTISIALAQDAGNVVLDVVDTGPGIAAEDKPRVFEAFYQGTSAYEGHIKGSGLGLAIAREYVTAHHGRLEIIDDTPQGAHFRMTLPTRTGKEMACSIT